MYDVITKIIFSWILNTKPSSEKLEKAEKAFFAHRILPSSNVVKTNQGIYIFLSGNLHLTRNINRLLQVSLLRMFTSI